MTASFWSTVQHFTSAEFPQDPSRVQPTVVTLLDAIRDALGMPIIVHEAWARDGHVEGSSHADGWAVDFHVPDLPLLDQWLYVERWPVHGLGLYPYWDHPGLHLDLRPYGIEHQGLGRRWWRDRDGTYRALDRDLLRLLV